MKHLLLLLSVFAFLKLNAQTVPSPSQTDEIIIDNGASGKADPADRIRYKVTIQNTGGANANGVQFNAVPDPRTTFVPGSFRSSPLAVPDAYACTGNVGIIIPVGSGVKANDFDDNIAGASITAATFASTQGGTVVMAADGSFDYTPPAGFTGTDNFTYTLNDGNPVGLPVPTTDAGSVTITVSNLIWFIDNSAGAGDGRRNSPFNTIAAFNAGSAAAGDVIYIEHTGTDYTGPLTLQNTERVFGEGHTGGANLANVLPFSLAANSKTLPNINGSRPNITNGSGNGIAIASNNTLRGLNIGNTTGADIIGTNFGTLTASEMTLSGNGKALDLTTGTLSATFDAITSASSGTQGILLSSVGGSLTATGGTTISGVTTQGILVTGSTVNANFGNTTITAGSDGVSLQNNSAGTRTFGTLSITNGSGVGFLHAVGGGLTNITGQATITNPGGRGIDIQNAAVANGVTFSNTNVTQSGGTGVHLQNNAGNITFADLDISPDANQRCIFATENTGTITSTSGTLANTGATSIEITKTSGTTPLAVSLTSVTVSGTATGILLSRTGGTFAINGVGTTNGSGGAISNITARGASFITASGITLKNITFTNASTTDAGGCGAASNASCNAAIHLDGVTTATLDNVDVSGTTQEGVNVRETSNFSLLNSTITQTGNNVEECALYGQNLFGQATIDNCALSFAGDRVAVIYNTDRNLDITVNSSSFNDSQTSATGADGLEFDSYGTSVTNMDVTGCTFLRDKTNAIQFIADNTSVSTCDVSNCTVDPGTGVGVGFDLDASGTASLKVNVNSNNVKGKGTSIINCFAQGSSNLEGQVVNNTVPSLGGSGTGIRSIANGNANVKIKIDNNVITGIALDNGISCRAIGGTGRMDATISNNNVTILSTASVNIDLQAGNSSSTFTNKACGNVFNNTVSPSPITGAIIANFFARSATASHELLLQGPNPIATYWNNKGNLPVSPTSTVTQSGLGVFTYNATCLLPSYP